MQSFPPAQHPGCSFRLADIRRPANCLSSTNRHNISFPVVSQNYPSHANVLHDARLLEIQQTYATIVAKVCEGMNTREALQDVGIAEWKFKRTKVIAEALLVDQHSFLQAIQKLKRPNLDNIKALAENISNRTNSRAALIQIAATGRALMPI
jgi:hypothetical protein